MSNNNTDKIIKEFLFHHLDEESKTNLTAYFSKRENNYSLEHHSVKNTLTSLHADIKLIQSVCPLNNQKPSCLSDLEISDKSFVVFGKGRGGCISKIHYSLD